MRLEPRMQFRGVVKLVAVALAAGLGER